MSQFIFFIDSLEKLTLKKDSSLLMALALKSQGQKVYLLFEKDFGLSNVEAPTFQCYEFSGKVDSDTLYIKSLDLGEKQRVTLTPGDFFFMRLDPPFDQRYLSYLWCLTGLELHGVKVSNSPRGILKHNEKMTAFNQYPQASATFVGHSRRELETFLNFEEKKGQRAFILKPLNLFQGMGVEKWDLEVKERSEFFQHWEELQSEGQIFLVQSFQKAIFQGEVRSLFFRGRELGTILKVPKEGSFLANVVQGSTFAPHELSRSSKKLCQKLAQDLAIDGIDLIAFDLIGDQISEVNVTCPGLVVEVSHALQENLALKMFT